MDNVAYSSFEHEALFDGESFTANATFDLSAFPESGLAYQDRSLAVDIPAGIQARVVVSKEQVEQPTIIIESTWTDEIPSSDLVAGRQMDTLLIGVSHH